VETLTGELTKAQEVNATLTKQVEDLLKLPATPKGALNAIAKGGTTPEQATEVEPIRKGDGTVDEAATLIKSIHRGKPVVIG